MIKILNEKVYINDIELTHHWLEENNFIEFGKVKSGMSLWLMNRYYTIDINNKIKQYTEKEFIKYYNQLNFKKC